MSSIRVVVLGEGRQTRADPRQTKGGIPVGANSPGCKGVDGGSRGFDSVGFKEVETAPSAASPGLRGLGLPGLASNFDRFPPSII